MSWPVGALREVLSHTAATPNRLDVAYYTQVYDECGIKTRFGRFQYGHDYNHPDERAAVLERLRTSVDAEMKKRRHDYVEWILLPGGDL